MGPGPNYFTDDEDHVWVDEQGQLHLTIKEKNGEWQSTEVIIKESFGYGSYKLLINSRVDNLDANAVLGWFDWETAAYDIYYREIDFLEIAKWGNPDNETNAQFVVHPCSACPGCGDNCSRFNIEQTDQEKLLTFYAVWSPGKVEFRAYKGDFFYTTPPATALIHKWEKDEDVPEPGNENVRINFWLLGGNAPLSGLEQEIVIADFDWQKQAPEFPNCGDNILDQGEECDDGGNENGDGCSSDCLIEEEPDPVCGNGIIEEGESCDDGNSINTDSCLNTCEDASCGDSYVYEGYEECDDGGNENGDGCSSDCLIEDPCNPGITIDREKVPDYGDKYGKIYGSTSCINPDDYAVAVYIKVRGGWWTKPYWSMPSTPIKADKSWVCDITTGGVDEEATEIRAYLIPANYDPPLRGGQSTLPDELDENALDMDFVERSPE